MATDRRRQVHDTIRASTAPLTLAQVAESLGVHANTVRFHVDRLLEAGQLEAVGVEHEGPGRPPAYYRATRRMDPEGPRRYRVLAEILVGSLAAGPDRQERALEAGRTWGRGLAAEQGEPAGSPTDELLTLLDDVGFAPQRRAGHIALRHCPFLELAQQRTDVVCPVHLGMMQGALEAWSSDVTATRLDPFVEPDLCVAHLDAVRGT